MKKMIALMLVLLCIFAAYGQTADDTKKTEDELEDVVDEAKTKINKVINKDKTKTDETIKTDETEKDSGTEEDKSTTTESESDDEMITERDPALRSQAYSYRNGGIGLVITGSIIMFGVGLPITISSAVNMVIRSPQDEINYNYNMSLIYRNSNYPDYQNFLTASLVAGISVMGVGLVLDIVAVLLFGMSAKTMNEYRKGGFQSILFEANDESMRLGLSLRF